MSPMDGSSNPRMKLSPEPSFSIIPNLPQIGGCGVALPGDSGSKLSRFWNSREAACSRRDPVRVEVLRRVDRREVLQEVSAIGLSRFDGMALFVHCSRAGSGPVNGLKA